MDRARERGGLPMNVGERLQLLGTPALIRADGGVTELNAAESALLARLVLDGPQKRGEIAVQLWPYTDDVRGNLRKCLQRLAKKAAGVEERNNCDFERISCDPTKRSANGASLRAVDRSWLAQSLDRREQGCACLEVPGRDVELPSQRVFLAHKLGRWRGDPSERLVGAWAHGRQALDRCS